MRILSISLILLFGIASLWFASESWGIGYDPDSIIYEDVAENWMAGHGIMRFNFATGERYPMTNFPPLYPLVLGLLSQVFGSVSDSARFLNTALWGGVWLMLYAWIRRHSQTHGIAWFSATVLMVNLLVLQVYGTSWSEPLFMMLGMSGLWFVLNYCDTWQQKHLVFASILFACTILTRYAGVAFVATAGVMLLTVANQSWRERMQSIVGLGVISGLPLLVWLLRNITVRGDVANRDIGFTVIGLPQLENTIQTLGSWLIPVPELTVNLMVLALMGALLGWTYFSTRKHESAPDMGLKMMRWWIIIYMLFIVASFSFVDPRIPFNYRILLPAYIGLVILIGRGLTLHWYHFPKSLRLTWLVVGLVLIVINSILALNWVEIISRTGQQYSDARFKRSTIIQDLHDEPTTATLFTNNNFLFHYLTNKPAQTLPYANDSDVKSWLDSLPDDETIQIAFFSLLSQRDWESTMQLESLLPITQIGDSEVVTLYELDLPNE
jgi:hypothetical protein